MKSCGGLYVRSVGVDLGVEEDLGFGGEIKGELIDKLLLTYVAREKHIPTRGPVTSTGYLSPLTAHWLEE